jgi:arylsulfatase A-like enzyme
MSLLRVRAFAHNSEYRCICPPRDSFYEILSVSTFTTPSVASILTGLYPSESYVYQLEGRLGDAAVKSLPHLLRSAGYATGAFMSNPLANQSISIQEFRERLR